jgi:hypothetical protein
MWAVCMAAVEQFPAQALGNMTLLLNLEILYAAVRLVLAAARVVYVLFGLQTQP